MFRVVALASLSVVSAAYSNIAGYTPPTDVVQHNQIDLDQADIEKALKAKDYAEAIEIYSQGRNSKKSSGMRTIKYMSKDLSGEALFDEFKAYYQEATFPNTWVTAALGGTEYGSGADTTPDKSTAANSDVADFSSISDDSTREQAVKKGTVQMIIWPYAVHELESAIGKCGEDETKSLHYLDEAVAFYTGSLVGSDATGDTKGKLMWGLAESRCKDFVTCADGTDGLAQQNARVFALFDEFKAAIYAGECTKLRGLTKAITDAGYIAIIQGTLKYGSVAGKSRDSPKYNAEAATFAHALLPRINTCSPADAKIVYNNLNLDAASTDFTAVKAALERNYACMGVVCADIGTYTKDEEAQYTNNCQDALGRGNGLGALIGIIVGGVVGLVLIVYLVLWKMGKVTHCCPKKGNSTTTPKDSKAPKVKKGKTSTTTAQAEV